MARLLVVGYDAIDGVFILLFFVFLLIILQIYNSSLLFERGWI